MAVVVIISYKNFMKFNQDTPGHDLLIPETIKKKGKIIEILINIKLLYENVHDIFFSYIQYVFSIL